MFYFCTMADMSSRGSLDTRYWTHILSCWVAAGWGGHGIFWYQVRHRNKVMQFHLGPPPSPPLNWATRLLSDKIIGILEEARVAAARDCNFENVLLLSIKWCCWEDWTNRVLVFEELVCLISAIYSMSLGVSFELSLFVE